MNEITGDLLQEFKNRLHITHNSEDDHLKRLLAFSVSDLIAKCGTFDVHTNAQARELVFERARYAYNDAVEFFDDNFLGQITALGVSLAAEKIQLEEGETGSSDSLQKALEAYDKKPLIIEGAPTIVPEYIGQTAFDKINKIAFIAGDLSADSWQVLGSQGGGEGGGVIYWGAILGKPTSFPPSEHTHSAAEINDFDSAVQGAIPPEYLTTTEGDARYMPKGQAPDLTWQNIKNKPTSFPPSAHGHGWNEIAGKPTDFPPSDHTHAQTDVQGLQEALGNKADADHSHGWNDIADKPTSFPPGTHGHAIQEIDGLQTALDGKADAANVYSKAETYNKAEIDALAFPETGGGGAVPIEDSLTSDSTARALSAKQGKILNETKANKAHTHTTAEITDFSQAVSEAIPPEYLTESEADAKYQPKGAESGSSWGNISGDIANQTDLQNALSSKASAEHSHSWGEVTEKPTVFPPEDHAHSWAEITDKPTDFPPGTHDHTIGEIAGLEAELNSKAAADHAHSWDEITEKPTDFPPGDHGHAIEEIAGLRTELNGKAATNHAHAWNEVTEKPTNFPAAPHTHGMTEIEGLSAALDSKANTADLALKADGAHSHEWDEIEGKPTSFPSAPHDHDIGEIAGLQAALDEKANTSNVYTKAEVDALTAGGAGSAGSLESVSVKLTSKISFSSNQEETIKFDTVSQDSAGNFDLTESVYTIETTGVYLIVLNLTSKTISHSSSNTYYFYLGVNGERERTFYNGSLPYGESELFDVSTGFFQSGDQLKVVAGSNLQFSIEKGSLVLVKIG